MSGAERAYGRLRMSCLGRSSARTATSAITFSSRTTSLSATGSRSNAACNCGTAFDSKTTSLSVRTRRSRTIQCREARSIRRSSRKPSSGAALRSERMQRSCRAWRLGNARLSRREAWSRTTCRPGFWCEAVPRVPCRSSTRPWLKRPRARLRTVRTSLCPASDCADCVGRIDLARSSQPGSCAICRLLRGASRPWRNLLTEAWSAITLASAAASSSCWRRARWRCLSIMRANVAPCASPLPATRSSSLREPGAVNSPSRREPCWAFLHRTMTTRRTTSGTTANF